MNRTTRIELFKENFKFSAGHFTIFSATERENIHGHNFAVHVAFDLVLDPEGAMLDYGVAKKYIESLCRAHNEVFLVPMRSPYLRVEEEAGYVTLHFNGERIPFLKRDVKLLPIANVTIEELAEYLLEAFLSGYVATLAQRITRVEIRVFSGPGQSGNAIWEASA